MIEFGTWRMDGSGGLDASPQLKNASLVWSIMAARSLTGNIELIAGFATF
jgi:hypothetical protein